MQPLITVIVPVYKVEPYLTRCLDSLRRQSLKDIEILLIDDASPDRCGEICDAYAAKDARFIVIHNEKNRGLSGARNIGIEHAAADYLMFLDSDDWVHEDFCKTPYECAVKYNADLVMFNFEYVENNRNCKPCHKNVSSGYKKFDEAIDLLLKNPSVWNKIYSKKLFNGVRFPEGFLFEDAATTYKLFDNALRIYYLDNILYHYSYNRFGSISTKKGLKFLRDWFEMNLRLYKGLSIIGYSKEKADLFFQKIALSYCIKKKMDFTDPYYVISTDVIQNINYAHKDFTWKQKSLISLFQLSPKLFNLICIVFNKHID